MSIIVHDDFEPINNYKPTLPNDTDIIEQCKKANVANLRAHANISGVVVVDAAGHRFWVKFGTDISLAEARTQHYVAWAVSNHGDAAPVRVPAVYRFLEWKFKRYIVMEFVDGRVCTDADARAVGAAVSFLIKITAPADQLGPGPIGGGPVCHDFFIHRMSPVTYPTLELLSSHINGILEHAWKTGRVDLVPRVDLRNEVETYGLRLCLSDTNRDNFMRHGKDNQIVAIDFGASCFLPISFFEMALGHSDPFTRSICPFVKRPVSTQANELHLASSSLVQYQDNEIGLPAELKGQTRR